MTEVEDVTDAKPISAAAYSTLIKIEDPRPRAEKFPYSCALPSEECLNAIRQGDSVTVEISLPNRLQPAADLKNNVPFEVLSVTSDSVKGLMRIPPDWPASDSDILIELPKWAVKGVAFADPAYKHLAELPRDKYPGWCLFYTWGHPLEKLRLPDTEFLYREEPKTLPENETRPDSGWRISSYSRPMADEDVYLDRVRYLPISLVLEVDDSWLYLIDKPIGSAFKRCTATSFLQTVAPEYGLTRDLEEYCWRALLAKSIAELVPSRKGLGC